MKANQLEVKKERSISNEQLIALYKKSKDIKIRNKIILNNMGLVYVAARKRIKTSTCFTFDDLVQEGIIGMIKGIEKFDVTRNTSFSTYVYYWIMQQMDRAIMNNGYMVRLPAYVYEKINRVSTAENSHLTKEQEIDLEALCDEINFSEEEYFLINYYKKNYCGFTSLNTIINMDSDENYVELQDYIPCQELSIEDIIVSENLKELLIGTLNTLTPKEREVLEFRFGLNGDEPLTLEAIGNQYNLTRERIRQIENKALKRLEKINYRTGLKDFLIEY